MYGIAGLLTGRTLAGRYLIEAVIGRGGMGAVYRAVDERLSRPVALKVIGATTVDPTEHGRLRQRFHREARAAAALHHANVVLVHDYGTDPELDLDFLVMELLRGEDLAARLLRVGPPSLPASLSILQQAARGLHAGHRVGMVHRDVKPGNLFLEATDHSDIPHVKVLDFGIAQVEADEATVTHLTQFGRSPFSPAYASPEQLRGDEAITPASDVFSLGAVGYHLATGRRPFSSSDPGAASAELSESLRLLPERAPALDDDVLVVLRRALALDPAVRYRDAGQFADALGGVKVPVTRVEVGEPTRLFPAPTAAGRPTPTPPAPAPRPAPAPVVAVKHTHYAPPPVPRHPAPAPATPAASPQAWPPQDVTAGIYPAAKREGGRIGRFLRALWEFTVTTVSLALFVGAWAAAVSGVVEGDRRMLLAGAAATVLLTPLAVHRLTGGRGRYSFGVIGSVLATAGALHVVGLDADPAIGLAAMFGLQIFACFVMAWLTKRKEESEGYASA